MPEREGGGAAGHGRRGENTAGPRLGLCDPHIHTRFSDGVDEPERIVDHAERLSWLDVIAVTDHNTVEGALRARAHASRIKARVSVIVGEEISSREGHVAALFISRRIPPGLSAAETVIAIHEQGGVAIAVHPFWRPGRYGVAGLAGELAFDAVEVLNGAPAPSTMLANRRAGRCDFGDRAQSGGSDAHLRQAIGSCCTTFAGQTSEAFRAAIEGRATKPVRRRLPTPRYVLLAARTVFRTSGSADPW